MRDLSTLLERISRALNKDSFIKGAIRDTVERCTRVLLPQDAISIKRDVLEITASSAGKNEIKFHEEEILNVLKSEYKIFISRILYH